MSDDNNSTSGLRSSEVSRRLKSAIDQFERHDLSRGELVIELKRLAVEVTGESDSWEKIGPDITRLFGRLYGAHAKACSFCEPEEDISDDEARAIINLIDFKLSTIGL
jgi:hypothetical protein